ITKLMTALVATDHMNIEKTITVNSKAIIQTSLPRLQTGEEASIYDLLFPLLLESSNEAAEAIAYAPGRERFVKLMNEKAKAIGMNQTNFADPAGRADENTGSAEDLLSLAKYLYSNRSFILKMTTNHLDKSIYGEPAYSNLKNLNIFGDEPDFVGGKVGKSTIAKETMLAVFEVEIQGERRPIVIIVLGSSDNGGDVKKILDYIETNYGA
ncbi:MAG: D-alanyl-D-alanine carboxypeptidase, partial [Candidatus Colwellbacteria bacterium]|nr:D-alanyl-D-alanine carboxypeptidase [Candidatus Colwellbacteria bacterium]